MLTNNPQSWGGSVTETGRLADIVGSLIMNALIVADQSREVQSQATCDPWSVG
jgi:hypothetical protein